ncbi:polysaccharide deacetylase family protein [Paenibacillus sp. N1-5-1-14]|uniref:polysaccharide deacetylase family protein n=1 Tax=Paenibacillus radicibacter TaxID=2972488 RepID=UPI0021594035|nr:polysaccharide deacetylase family protein [Paenibacillus radicibacter]MCR8644987.1 polysaccharide deacetylase family protein [Paenibacillus radicibacter]
MRKLCLLLLLIMVMLVAAACQNKQATPSPDPVSVDDNLQVTFTNVSFSETLKSLKNKPMRKVHYRNQAIVLMYHEIKDSGQPFALSSADFESHIRMLLHQGYNIISIEQFEDYMSGKIRTIPDNAVVLTFDDGYEDFYQNAYPILQKYNVTATNFVIVKSTDIYNSKIIPHMTWDQIREMRSKGFSFYSHTYDHHRKINIDDAGTKIGALASPAYNREHKQGETREEYRARIKADLMMAEELLKKEVSNTRSILAFPYGEYSEDTISIGKELGINLFYTVEEGMNKRGATLISRINAGVPNLSAKQLWMTMKKYDDRTLKSSYKFTTLGI